MSETNRQTHRQTGILCVRETDRYDKHCETDRQINELRDRQKNKQTESTVMSVCYSSPHGPVVINLTIGSPQSRMILSYCVSFSV